MKASDDQRGFSALIVLLLLLFLLLIAFAGWRIWQNKDEKQPTSGTNTSATQEAEDEDGAPGGERVKPPSESYSVVLPEAWKTGTCPDSPHLIFLAPTTELLGKCSSESFGTVSVSRHDGDTRKLESYYTREASWGSISYDNSIMIDGLPGNRVGYTQVAESLVGYPPVGTKEILYDLYDASSHHTYTIGYRQLPTEPNNEAAFTTIAESFDR